MVALLKVKKQKDNKFWKQKSKEKKNIQMF